MVYRLSATLTGHTSDVRAVSSPTPSLVLSVSRDTKAIAWSRSDTSPHFAPSTLYQAGSRYVNSVAYLAPSEDAPSGSLVAGGQDSLINIFPIGQVQSEPTHTLLGHTENVCALDATVSGTIISGSWDKTARVWKNYTTKYELKGHAQAVWAVVAIDDDQYLTGSADKTIRHWVQHKSIKTFTGHTDAVRGLAVVPDIGFVSCSNDSEIRVWTLGGDVIHVLSGHTSFVYSLALLPNGDIVSSGEDRSVRVWKDGECSQVIVLPAISVWAVSTMPNGDIVSGSSDGLVRVFSEKEERWADAEDLKKYDDEVARQALPSQQIGDVKKSDLPGPEALNSPGKKEGQVLMIKTAGGSVEAHQWTSGTWQKVGDVVDAVGQGRKQLYEGKEYDYVFDVDIQDGVPPLKLPYNVADNPYQAALKFLQANEISEAYIDQVVQFIEKNTAGQQLGVGGDTYVDPYTGASRYQASASSNAPNQGTSTYQDPFTGAGGYHGSPAPPSSNAGGSYQDPFTGASGYHGATAAPPAPRPSIPRATTSNAILPVRTALPFKQANVPAMRTKLFGLNDSIVADPATTNLAFTSDETAALNRIFIAINEASPDPASTVSANIKEADVAAALRIAERWPVSSRFPVIDLVRLIAAHAPGIVSTAANGPSFVRSVLTASEWAKAPWSSPLPKTSETNTLLALRALANLFQPQAIAGLGEWDHLLFEELLKPSFAPLAKNQWVALATILLNYSCLIIQNARSGAIISSDGVDSEALYRALVAIGNIIYVSKARRVLDASALTAAVSLSRRVANAEERFKTVAREIGQLTSDTNMMSA